MERRAYRCLRSAYVQESIEEPIYRTASEIDHAIQLQVDPNEGQVDSRPIAGGRSAIRAGVMEGIVPTIDELIAAPPNTHGVLIAGPGAGKSFGGRAHRLEPAVAPSGRSRLSRSWRSRVPPAA